MPSLKQISCSIEYGPDNTALKEYQRRYHDGVVESFVCVPPSNLPFHIHVTSNGYIAPGLAVFVFMDGEYQCNRNRNNLREPTDGSDPKHSEDDFRLRQKEEKKSSGGFVGREWTFSELDTGKADAAESVTSRFLNNVGTIEVVVLRCKARRDDDRAGSSKTTKNAEPPQPPASRAKSTKQETPVVEVTEDAFGGMFGLFDGAGDEIGRLEQLDGASDRRPSPVYRRAYRDESTYSQERYSRPTNHEHRQHREPSPRRYRSPPPRTHRPARTESEEMRRDRFRRYRSPSYTASTESEVDRHPPRRGYGYEGGFREPEDRHTERDELRDRGRRIHDRSSYQSSPNIRGDRKGRDYGGFVDQPQRYDRHHNEYPGPFPGPYNSNVPSFNYAHPYGAMPWYQPDTGTDQEPIAQEHAEVTKMREDCSAMYTALMEAGSQILRMNQEIYVLENRCKSATDYDKEKLDKEIAELKSKRAGSDTEQEKKFKEWQEADATLRKRDEELHRSKAHSKHINTQGSHPYAGYYPRMPHYYVGFHPAYTMPGQWPMESPTTPGVQNQQSSARVHWADFQNAALGAQGHTQPEDKSNKDSKNETATQTEGQCEPNATGESKPDSTDDKNTTSGSPWDNNDGDKKEEHQEESTPGWGNGNNDKQPEVQNESNSWENNNNNDSNQDNSGGDSWGTSGNTDGAVGWDNNDNSGDGNNGGDSWANNDDNKKEEEKKASEHGSKARSHHTSAKSTTSSSTPAPKPYWSEWQHKVRSHPDPEPRRARDPYYYAPEPVPSITPKDKQVTHAVQSGKGASYAHETHKPEYLDTLAKPYAVFTFKYRSKKALEKILKKEIEQPINKAQEKERMLGMSKEELIEEMLKRSGVGSVKSIKKDEKKEDEKKEDAGWGGGSSSGSKQEDKNDTWGGGSTSGSKNGGDGWAASVKSGSKKSASGWASNTGSKKNGNDNSGGGGGWNDAGAGTTGGGGGVSW